MSRYIQLWCSLSTVAVLLLSACQTHTTTETNATRGTTGTQTPASADPSDRSSSSPAFGLLASLPVDVSAVLAAGPLLFDSRTFTGFGMPKVDNPDEVSPQWEFAVPPGTPALAPVTGYVVAIETLWSDDFTIWLSADGGRAWVWELEHVVEVRVGIGDFVEAGQPIATASIFGGRNIALVELGVLKGGQVPVHYCPLLYVDEYALPAINEGLAAIRQENFERLNSQGLVSDPEDDPYGQACWTGLHVSDES